MRIPGSRPTGRSHHAALVPAGVAVLLALLSPALASCAPGGADAGTRPDPAITRSSGEGARTENLSRLPGIGDRLRARIPDDSRQVVAVYGEGKDAAGARVELWLRDGAGWSLDRGWAGHNGKRGWTPDHREDDKRSPVGVFTLSDAGGVLPAPGTKLPYTATTAFTPPSYWPRSTRHDFDHVIAIDYNRVRGTTPLDPTRPRGQDKGGSIWLHLDHGSGTSGCVSVSRAAMEHLLRTLDPAQHPVVVMGDRAALRE